MFCYMKYRNLIHYSMYCKCMSELTGHWFETMYCWKAEEEMFSNWNLSLLFACVFLEVSGTENKNLGEQLSVWVRQLPPVVNAIGW